MRPLPSRYPAGFPDTISTEIAIKLKVPNAFPRSIIVVYQYCDKPSASCVYGLSQSCTSITNMNATKAEDKVIYLAERPFYRNLNIELVAMKKNFKKVQRN